MSDKNRETSFETFLPTPMQLRRLAHIGARSAAERNRLKPSKHPIQHAYSFIDETDFYNTLNAPEYFDHIIHRMVGRIGVTQAGVVEAQDHKLWSLRLLDTYFMSQGEEGWFGERRTYRFEWNRLRTVLAEKTIQIMTNNTHTVDELEIKDRSRAEDSVIKPGIYDVQDGMKLEMDILSAQLSREIVSLDNCEELIEATGQYFNAIDSSQGRVA